MGRCIPRLLSSQSVIPTLLRSPSARPNHWSFPTICDDTIALYTRGPVPVRRLRSPGRRMNNPGRRLNDLSGGGYRQADSGPYAVRSIVVVAVAAGGLAGGWLGR